MLDKVPVVKDELPESSGVPPVCIEYQSILAPVDAVAEIVAVFPLHIVALFVDITVGNKLTVTVTALLDALKHPVDIFLASA